MNTYDVFNQVTSYSLQEQTCKLDTYRYTNQLTDECRIYINSKGGQLCAAVEFLIKLKMTYKALHCTILNHCGSAAGWVAGACQSIDDTHSRGILWHSPSAPTGLYNIKPYKRHEIVSGVDRYALYQLSKIVNRPILESKNISSRIKVLLLNKNEDIMLASNECKEFHHHYTSTYLNELKQHMDTMKIYLD